MSKRLVQKKAARIRRQAPELVPPAASRPNRFHRFLRRLRAGGRSNMYGAIPYLMHAFALDRDAAYRVVCEWLDREAKEAEEALQVSTPTRPTVLSRGRPRAAS
jgi:hypothetical protein